MIKSFEKKINFLLKNLLGCIYLWAILWIIIIVAQFLGDYVNNNKLNTRPFIYDWYREE